MDESNDGVMLSCPACENNSFRCFMLDGFINVKCLQCGTQVGKINMSKEPQIEVETDPEILQALQEDMDKFDQQNPSDLVAEESTHQHTWTSLINDQGQTKEYCSVCGENKP